jgi:Tfp pilus assembly ATPase PilU
MRDGEIDGMQDFDTVIREMITNETVTLDDGLSYATNQNNLLLQLKGLGGTEDFINQQASQPASNVITPPPSANNNFLDLME